MYAMSPVLSHPSSVNVSLVASGFPQYPFITLGARTHSSPRSPCLTSCRPASSSTIFASQFGANSPTEKECEMEFGSQVVIVHVALRRVVSSHRPRADSLHKINPAFVKKAESLRPGRRDAAGITQSHLLSHPPSLLHIDLPLRPQRLQLRTHLSTQRRRTAPHSLHRAQIEGPRRGMLRHSHHNRRDQNQIRNPKPLHRLQHAQEIKPRH